jgi:hypothetical protein
MAHQTVLPGECARNELVPSSLYAAKCRAVSHEPIVTNNYYYYSASEDNDGLRQGKRASTLCAVVRLQHEPGASTKTHKPSWRDNLSASPDFVP